MGHQSSILVDHWRGLTRTIHPEDEPFFASVEHSFNLDWPPPAYIGDVISAPFVLLMMNGGFHPRLTPAEFPDLASVEQYRAMLHNPRALDPSSISPYYRAGNYEKHIASGRLALVNAVAYRSGKLSAEKLNCRLAKRLPSTLKHQQWLREELIPQALEGKRIIIAHRNRMWKLRQHEYQNSNIIFTRSGASPHLPKTVLSILDRGI